MERHTAWRLFHQSTQQQLRNQTERPGGASMAVLAAQVRVIASTDLKLHRVVNDLMSALQRSMQNKRKPTIEITHVIKRQYVGPAYGATSIQRYQHEGGLVPCGRWRLLLGRRRRRRRICKAD